MGFFNFGKKDKAEKIQSEKKQNKPISPVQASNPPSPVVQGKEPEQRATYRPKSKQENIGDRFKINIHNIFKYEPAFVEETVWNGEPVKKYALKLSDLELSTFYRVSVIQLRSGAYHLIFESNVNEIRKGLAEFVDSCIKLYGADFMNKGGVDEKDYRDTALGVFSRVWFNKVRLENIHFTMSLTIYNIIPR